MNIVNVFQHLPGPEHLSSDSVGKIMLCYEHCKWVSTLTWTLNSYSVEKIDVTL